MSYFRHHFLCAPARGGGVRNPLKLKKHLKFSDSYNIHGGESRATFLSRRHGRGFLLKLLVHSFSADREPIAITRFFEIQVIVLIFL